MAHQEFWYLTNTQNRDLTITDVPGLPVLKPNTRLEALQFASPILINKSIVLRNYINKGWVTFEQVPVFSQESDFRKIHNEDAGLQGGVPDERYHLSKDQHDILITGVDASSLHTHDDKADVDHTHENIFALQSDFVSHISSSLDAHGITDTSDLVLKSGSVTQLSDVSSTGLQIDAAVDASHAELHAIENHADTSATGLQLNILIGGEPTTLHAHVHNNLTELQGGIDNEYYHLTAIEHKELANWLDNVDLNTEGGFDIDSGLAFFDALHNIITFGSQERQVIFEIYGNTSFFGDAFLQTGNILFFGDEKQISLYSDGCRFFVDVNTNPSDNPSFCSSSVVLNSDVEINGVLSGNMEIWLDDNEKIYFGDNRDSSIYFNSVNLIFDSQEFGNGNFEFENGTITVTGIADGALTSYDLLVGDTITPDYGMIQFGGGVIGRTSHSEPGLNLDGTVIVRNLITPAVSNIEYAFADSSTSIHFAIPARGIGKATYNSRSILIAGPAPTNDAMVTVGYWQGQGIFDNLLCDTDNFGADLGVQNNLEVEGDMFVDSIIESTVGANILLGSNIWLGEDYRNLYFGANKDATVYFDGCDLNVDFTNPSDCRDPSSLQGLVVRADTIIEGTLDVGNRVTGAYHEDLKDMPSSSNTDHDGRYVNLSLVHGSFKESFSAIVSSDGAIVTITIINQDNPSSTFLTVRFSDGDLEIPVPTTIDSDTGGVSVGSDTAPSSNYLYVPISTKVLTVSTIGFPEEEHAKIAYFFLPSASFIQSYGVYINQNWNDPLDEPNEGGHILHISERLRRDSAKYFSGLDPNGTDQDTNSSYFDYVSGTEVYFKMNTGIVYQLHKRNINSFDSRNTVILVKNWFGDSYHDINNLTDITADSTGTSLSNYFNLVFWAAANKLDEFDPIICNLPSGSYPNLSDAQNDVDGYDDFTIPREFSIDSSTAVLICRMTLREQGVNWSHESTTDLRGQENLYSASGGAAGVVTDFSDNQFTIFNVSDITKILDFDISAVTTSTMRTITMKDADLDLADVLLRDGSVDLTSDWGITANNIIFNDNVGIVFGTGDNSKIFFDGTNLNINIDNPSDIGPRIKLNDDVDISGGLSVNLDSEITADLTVSGEGIGKTALTVVNVTDTGDASVVIDSHSNRVAQISYHEEGDITWDLRSSNNVTNNPFHIGRYQSGVFVESALTIDGSTGISTFEQGIIIDDTATEAFLVRQDSDAADVFVVDTTNKSVGVNQAGSAIVGLGVTKVFTADDISKDGALFTITSDDDHSVPTSRLTTGINVTLDESGSNLSSGGTKTMYGGGFAITYTGTVNNSLARNRQYGVYASSVFSGTNTSSLGIDIFGVYGTASGDIGGTGDTNHYALYGTVSGTADNNYGLFIASVLGATNNYGIWDASGADWVLDGDSQKIIFGEEQAAEIYYNGTDLIIDANAAGTGAVEFRADNMDVLEIGNGANAFLVEQNITADVAGTRLISSSFDFAHGSTAITNQMDSYFVNLRIDPDGGGASGTITQISNIRGNISAKWTASCDITEWSCFRAVANWGSSYTGTITDLIGYAVQGWNDTSIDVMNAYGFKSEDITVGTNSYAIYTGLGEVSFGDDVHFRNDNDRIFFGADKDASLSFIGTNLVLDFENPSSDFMNFQVLDTRLSFNNSNTVQIWENGTDLAFKDPNAGTLTLSEMSKPKVIYIDSVVVGGNPSGVIDSLVDVTNWNVNKAVIKTIKVVTTSEDWDLIIYSDGSGTGGMFDSIILVQSGNTSQDILIDLPYIDNENANQVHLKFNCNDNIFDSAQISILGIEAR